MLACICGVNNEQLDQQFAAEDAAQQLLGPPGYMPDMPPPKDKPAHNEQLDQQFVEEGVVVPGPPGSMPALDNQPAHEQ